MVHPLALFLAQIRFWERKAVHVRRILKRLGRKRSAKSRPQSQHCQLSRNGTCAPKELPRNGTEQASATISKFLNYIIVQLNVPKTRNRNSRDHRVDRIITGIISYDCSRALAPLLPLQQNS
jgi:hypothetical protein